MANMELPPVLKKVVDWLRAGYPEGVPDVDYIPLFALLGSELSNHDVELIADDLASSTDPQSAEAIRKAITAVTNPVCSAVNQWPPLSRLPRLPGMHIMQALVGCQKRSTKILTRSLNPIDGVGCMRGPGEGHHATSSEARSRDPTAISVPEPRIAPTP